MEAYTDFASVYDEFMDATPYEEWKNKIISILHNEGIIEGLILDLGCGTGTMTQLLAQSGYDMIGIDLSMDMLNVAMEKRQQSGQDILYLCQDMRSFELYGTVRAIVSICDSINYILNPQELQQVFTLVNNYLDPRGIFVFDFNTVHKYRDIIGDCVIAENRDECSFIWDNYYDKENRRNEYELVVFVKDANAKTADGSERYRKFEEVHYQRGYELEEILQCLMAAGMDVVEAYDTDSLQEPGALSERITVIAREHGKENRNEME
ncbi:MAG TPA: methyltransferase domain-containing protein [Lachnospiraceae bacterium]|nr:methyltransferase domain-containing protein [Lachnospiraceae bacterium]